MLLNPVNVFLPFTNGLVDGAKLADEEEEEEDDDDEYDDSLASASFSK